MVLLLHSIILIVHIMNRYSVVPVLALGILLCSAGVVFAEGHRYHDDDNYEYRGHEWHHKDIHIARHADIIAAATSEEGAVVLYDAPTATDRVEGAIVTVSCVPASNTLFALGRTEVRCTATDDQGSRAQRSHFTVRVRNIDNPNITITVDTPAGVSPGAYEISVDATDEVGAMITYHADATDDTGKYDLSSLSCTPSSPHEFLVADEAGVPIVCTMHANSHHENPKKIFQDTAAVVVVNEVAPSAPPSVCSPSTIAHGTIGAYPTCAISCKAGYRRSGESCVVSTSSGNGGGGGGKVGGSSGTAASPTWSFNSTGAPSGGQGASTGNSSSPHVFTQPLAPGAGNGNSTARGEVLALQQFLNAHGFIIAESGPGSPGNETGIFGPATKAALAKFQEANAAAILAPLGLHRGSGVFGRATMRFINALETGQTPSAPAPSTTPGTGAPHSGPTTPPAPPVTQSTTPPPPPTPTTPSCPKWLCFWR